MQIKWTNLIALGMILFTVILLVKTPALFKTALMPLRGLTGDAVVTVGRHAGAHPTVDDYTAGLIALAFICVTIVGVVRMLTWSRRDRDD